MKPDSITNHFLPYKTSRLTQSDVVTPTISVVANLLLTNTDNVQTDVNNVNSLINTNSHTSTVHISSTINTPRTIMPSLACQQHSTLTSECNVSLSACVNIDSITLKNLSPSNQVLIHPSTTKGAKTVKRRKSVKSKANIGTKRSGIG